MSRLVGIGALAAVLLAAIAFNFRARQRGPVLAPDAVAKASLALVTVERAAFGELREPIWAVGVVRSDQQAAITTRLPGRIMNILVQEGQRVSAGQTLARIDLGDADSQKNAASAAVDLASANLRKAVIGKEARRVELDSLVAQAETGLANAKVKLQQAELGSKLLESSARSDAERARAGVLQAQAGLRQAELAEGQAATTLKRVEFLHSKGGVPRADLEGARTQSEIARSQHEGAKAALRQAQAAEKPAVEAVPLRERVSKQDVEAAGHGAQIAEDSLATALKARTESLRIADRDIEAARAGLRQAVAGQKGTVTQIGNAALTSPVAGVVTDLTGHAGEVAQPGMPLMSIVSTTSVYVEASVPVRLASRVVSGASARISLAPGSPAVDAVVSGTLLAARNESRTFPVRLRLQSPSALLSPGMSVSVQFPVPAGEKRLLVPASALKSVGGQTHAMIVADGSAERRTVRIGDTDGSRTEVLSGLAEGDDVIVRAPEAVVPGTQVRVVR